MDNILLMMDIYVLKDDNNYLMEITSDEDNDYSCAFFQFLGIYDNNVALMVFMKDKRDIWYCDIDNFRDNFISIRDWIIEAEIVSDVIMTNDNHSLVRFYASEERTFAFDTKDNCFYLVNNGLDYEVNDDDNFRLEGNLLKQLIKDLKIRRKY